MSVNFTAPVQVTGTPQIALTIGAQTRQAACYSGCGGSTTSSLRFEYVVQSSDDDDDGISIGADALSLPPGSSITLPGDNSINAVLTHDTRV